jgi:hypothetical protein
VCPDPAKYYDPTGLRRELESETAETDIAESDGAMMCGDPHVMRWHEKWYVRPRICHGKCLIDRLLAQSAGSIICCLADMHCLTRFDYHGEVRKSEL